MGQPLDEDVSTRQGNPEEHAILLAFPGGNLLAQRLYSRGLKRETRSVEGLRQLFHRGNVMGTPQGPHLFGRETGEA